MKKYITININNLVKNIKCKDIKNTRKVKNKLTKLFL